jgi:hypothetical protein
MKQYNPNLSKKVGVWYGSIKKSVSKAKFDALFFGQRLQKDCSDPNISFIRHFFKQKRKL